MEAEISIGNCQDASADKINDSLSVSEMAYKFGNNSKIWVTERLFRLNV